MQRIPVDRDLAASDTEEAAEIDDGRAHTPRAIDNDIDDEDLVSGDDDGYVYVGTLRLAF